MTKLNRWKVVKRFLIIAIEIAVLGVIGYITDRPELLYLMPFLEAIRNYIKHK